MASNAVSAKPTEFKALEGVTRLLETSKPGKARLVGPDGQHMIIPSSLYEVLRLAARELTHGNSVRILHTEAELSTQEAAEYLNISRPSLIKLLEAGHIPYHHVGSHRRVLVRELATYKDRRNAHSRRMLDELVADAQEVGQYDPE